VPVDISDSDSVAAAVAEVGEIDGVVFLAGLATLLKAQDWDTERVEQMFDVNLTGRGAGDRARDQADGRTR
jgi:NADP-dependent 3-hydroxy acid dehydrogenase YdfG